MTGRLWHRAKTWADNSVYLGLVETTERHKGEKLASHSLQESKGPGLVDRPARGPLR